MADYCPQVNWTEMCKWMKRRLVAIATVSTVTLTTCDYEHMQSVVRNGGRERETD